MLCRGYCNLCNSLAEWKHAMIVSHYINIIVILISCLILSLNLVTQMWKIILKYPGTFQYTFCRAHYETPKNWRNFIISNCPGGNLNTYIMPHIVIKSRHTNVRNHSEIFRYFSVHVLPCPLRNSKELAKFYHFKLPRWLPGQHASQDGYKQLGNVSLSICCQQSDNLTHSGRVTH